MAIVIQEVTIRGITQEAVVWEADTNRVIPTGALTSYDFEQLTALEATIDGDEITTMDEAAAAYVLPNGRTGAQHFGGLIVDVEQANASYVPKGAKFYKEFVELSGRVKALEDAAASGGGEGMEEE